MRLLIDSHILLWLLYEPDRIGSAAYAAIERADSVAVSVGSLWELALKHRAGKLSLTPSEMADGVDALNLDELPLSRRQVIAMEGIRLPHGDPFDALLVAQAQADTLTLVTADRHLLDSPYPTIDARR